MELERVTYKVNWQKFVRGTSFFIPCVDCKEVRKQLRKILRRMKLKVLIKISIEMGVRGLRVWRA